jgi:Bacterial membrane protein YfhO
MTTSARMRGDLQVAAVTLAVAFVLFPGALLRGESFFERDLHLDWYPRLEAIGRALSAGGWPLWDPTQGFGQPLLADPGAEVAYPLTWLALVVPRPSAYTVFVVAHLLLGALGTARLARTLGAGRTGGVGAAIAWTLCGPLQSSLNLWHHFAGASWMPWVLLGAHRIARTRGMRPILALAAASALQILAGSADLCAMTWLLAAGWVGFRLLEGKHRRVRESVGSLVVGLGFAACLTAVLWLPAAEVVSRSARRDLPEDIRTAWSITPLGLSRLLVPLDPDHVPFDPAVWRDLYDRPEQPFLASLYFGLPLLTLAGAAFLWRPMRGRASALAVGAALAVAFAMGPHGPLYPAAAFVVPLVRIFRYPSKAVFVPALAIALLVGLGVRSLRRGAFVGLKGALLSMLLVAGATLVAFVGLHYGGPLASRAAPLLAVVGAVVVAARARGRVGAPVAAAALLGLAAADLLAAHAGLNATAPASLIFDPPPLVQRVDRSGGRRLYVYDYHSLPGTSERLLGRPDPYRVRAFPPGRDRRRVQALALRLYLVPPSAGLFGLEGSYDLDLRGLYPRELNDMTFVVRQVEGTSTFARLLRLGAVGTVVSLHERGLEGLEPVAILPSLFPEPIRVWRVPGALPRAWLVGCARVADEHAAFAALGDESFDPAREVILALDPGERGECGPAGTAQFISSRGDRVELLTDASRPAFLVMADAYDPGWSATVDGRPAPLLRANVAFRSVAVPRGRHLVVLVYRPWSIRTGLAITVAALVALGALIAREAAGGRARAGPAVREPS